MDLKAIAAMAAKAKGNPNQDIAAPPDSLDEFVADLVDDHVLDMAQATWIRLLAAKEKVAAVAEAATLVPAPEVVRTDTAAVTQEVDARDPDELAKLAAEVDAALERGAQPEVREL